MYRIFILISLLSFLGSATIQAQVGDTTDLMSILDEQPTVAPKKDYVKATFKATRLISGYSVENLSAGVLDFRIMHRFGRLNQGIGDFFGLDNAVTGLGFDYGITRKLMVSISRSTYQKEYVGSVKYKILQQTVTNIMPITLSYAGTMMANTSKMEIPVGSTGDYVFGNRLSYCNQLLIARKFSERLSIQLTPSHLHYNMVNTKTEPNDIFSLGIGGRIKLTQRVSFNAEWFVISPDQRITDTRNAFAIGFDIETGGHVFQLHFTNSTGITERAYIGETTGNWAKGDVHFGFNVSRVFTVVKPKQFRDGTSRNKIY